MSFVSFLIRLGCTHIVVVLTAEVDGIHIHASVIGPVVCERNDELDASFSRSINNLVEWRDIDDRCSIGPDLEGDLIAAIVLRQARRIISSILVVEAPGTHHFESCLTGGRHAFDSVGIVLCGTSVMLGMYQSNM